MKLRILSLLPLLIVGGFLTSALAAERPNIILVFIDDMGWGDFSCFGNREVTTENIDRLAAEGLRFDQFYVNSPICSSSRVAISTGQYPQRWRITSYLAARKLNEDRGMAQWLDPIAPMLARFLKDAGYATGHFGKWHMGGQRDVGEAPFIPQYGFDESLTNFEGLGPRVLALCNAYDGKPLKKHFGAAENLPGSTEWVDRSLVTDVFVSAALKFIKKAETENKPFYINLWPDDVHSPHYPPENRWGDRKSRARYLGVLDTMDEQLGVLFDTVRDSEKLCNNTLLLVCSDNGPAKNAGSAEPFRGYKAQLYEGGVRSPLVVWGPGLVPEDKAGTVNADSVFAAIDLVPSLLDIAGVPSPDGVEFDGVNLAGTLLGKSNVSREKPLFFRRPPDRDVFYGTEDLPDLAIRHKKWKLLCEYDGSDPELYNLEDDKSETNNLAGQRPEIVRGLTRELLAWHISMPEDNGATFLLERNKTK